VTFYVTYSSTRLAHSLKVKGTALSTRKVVLVLPAALTRLKIKAMDALYYQALAKNSI